MKLISLDTINNMLEKNYDDAWIDEFQEKINSLPTIDPVEIIEKEKKIAQLFKDDKYADGYWDALHELLHKFNPSSHV